MRKSLHEVRFAFAELRPKDVVRYLVKAFLLAAFLMLVGTSATSLPWFAFPLIFPIYAIVATMGALYYVMIGRVHKQDMLYEGGKLSDWNRRWSLWLGAFFVFSLFSAFFFVLGAPRWDGVAWILIWLIAPLYGVAFVISDRMFKKQFRSQYHKAKAMKASGVIVLIVLCVAYAVLSIQSSVAVDGRPETLDVLRNPYVPFEAAPSVFLSEADKLSALMNDLTNYGLTQVAKTSYLAAFAVKFGLAFSVFLSVVSQFACCLLSWHEVKNEFKLLPARDDIDVFVENGPVGKNVRSFDVWRKGTRVGGERAESTLSTADRLSAGELPSEALPRKRPYVKKYFVIIALASMASFFMFGLLEDTALKMRMTNEYTAVDAFVEQHREKAIALLEGVLDEHVENQAISEEYKQKFAELIERRKTLDPMIDGYYDQCLLRVDLYLEWQRGFFGGLAEHLGGFGEGRAIKSFKSKVVDPIDKTELERAYKEYADDLMRLSSEYWIKINDGGSDMPTELSFVEDYVGENMEDYMRKKGELKLWKALDDGGESVRSALLGADGNVDDETRKALLVDFIDQARNDTFASLDEFERTCTAALGGSDE